MYKNDKFIFTKKLSFLFFLLNRGLEKQNFQSAIFVAKATNKL